MIEVTINFSKRERSNARLIYFEVREKWPYRLVDALLIMDGKRVDITDLWGPNDV